MQVHRFISLEGLDGKLFVVVRWRRLRTTEDTLEPIRENYGDVPQMLILFLGRQSTPAQLVAQARRTLGISEGGLL